MSITITIRKFLASNYRGTLLLLWTALIITSGSWNIYQNHQDTIARARIEARTIYRHNIAYRKWSTMHGGIYTRITEKDKNNPHFAINMTGAPPGLGFAMIDPFQMTKQAYEVLHEQAPNLAAITHTVSLDFQNTIDPYDEPDEWEKYSLHALHKGNFDEVSTIDTINDAKYLRLLKPYVIDRGCIKCHSRDFKIGSIHGGMSVAVPMKPYYETAVKTRRITLLTHMLLWLLGCLAIIKFSAAFRRYRAAIIENEEKFRIVSEFAYNFEYWIRENNKLAFISPSCKRLTGYSREEFIKNPKLLLEIIHPDDVDEYRNHLCSITAPEHEGTDFRVIKKDGQVRWFTHTCSPIHINGEFLGRRGSSLDVTDHKNLEERLMRAKQLEYLGQFAGGIAHDFNNVLGSINTFTHLLNDEIKDSNKTAADYVKYIKIAAKLGKNLTSNLLSFGKKQIVKPQKTTLKKIISHISDILKTLVDEEINYAFKLSKVDLEISADPHQIEQILINLCTNARDAMKDGGQITISTESVELSELRKGNMDDIPPGCYMALSVSDTGQGIDSVNLAKICEPFFTTKSSTKGTGLGLSIITNIVKQHNAFIDVKSVIGEGTTFTVYLPANSNSEADTTAPSAPPRTPESPPRSVTQPDDGQKQATLKAVSGQRPTTILLADDDELVRKSLSIPLERQGYEVITAEDGKKAIGLFLDRKDSIDLVILDVVMEKRNGKEVYDIIRKNDKEIKVIFISGYTDDILSREMIEKEELVFLTKPIETEVLLATISDVLQR